MIRLKDIAEKAGVSLMTVSKVLRDAPDISSATKVRIRALAQQMGYVPDSLAQGLRTRTTKLIGLVISASTNPIFARMVMAIEERAWECGYDLVLAHSLNIPEREETVLRRLLARRVDGLLICPVYRLSPSAPIYDELKRRNIPTVLVGHPAPFCEGYSNVYTDDLKSSYAATKHLIELGHRNIAFFAGPPGAPWAEHRLEGYRKAMREAHATADDSLVFNAGATIEEGETAGLQMINENTKITAIQAVNDLVAIGAANILLSQGTRIPQDISVIGHGNIMAAEHFRVPLTTIREPTYRMGTAAMDALMKLIQNQPPEPQPFEGELIIRASTAPPPGFRDCGQPATS